LTLSEDEARQLVAQVAVIIERHAGDTRRHRSFVHDFLRAVYHATGATYSAAFYRKLLGAYAPGRTPSTTTIETEKNLLLQDLKRRAIPRADWHATTMDDLQQRAPAAAPSPGTPLALQEILSLQHHLIARLNQLAAAPEAQADQGLQAHNDFLRERLASAEAELAATRARAARHAADAREQAALAADRGEQLAALHRTGAEQAAALAAMATELIGTRLFAMQAIDGVRGETRAVRERCAHLEAQLKEKDLQLDTYRQRIGVGIAPGRQ
jgi:hypothetical protein